uniref:RRM domain-containing protein n=1 Tax=Aegilops tauschii subsp. strangulata TaxID=200361 RepID=A0A453TAA2_AEGTS
APWADSPRRRYTRPSRSPSPYKGRQKQMSRSRSPVAQSQSRSPSPDPRAQARSRSRSPAREREPEAVNHGNTLYITGLSSRVTDKELREYFNKEGKVVSCHVVLEPHTRVSRGFAFITMDTVEDAERCIKYLNQSELQGRNITVEKVIVCASTWVVVLLVQMQPCISCVLTWRFFGGYSEDIVQAMCQQSRC